MRRNRTRNIQKGRNMENKELLNKIIEELREIKEMLRTIADNSTERHKIEEQLSLISVRHKRLLLSIERANEPEIKERLKKELEHINERYYSLESLLPQPPISP